ncbi:MAG: fibronectin type III domain-containing protein, partial [Candidatus Cloacimonetes bacterium]|nr:fibronectin type III domain-containing protein [Candidatus Cloacimonadota bacterium]
MKTGILFLLILLLTGYAFAQETDTTTAVEDSVKVKVNLPLRPTNLSAKALNDHTISLRWQSSKDDIGGYILLRKRGDEEFIEVKKLEKNKTFFVDEELIFNVKYSYKVQAYKNDVRSEFSDEITLS